MSTHWSPQARGAGGDTPFLLAALAVLTSWPEAASDPTNVLENVTGFQPLPSCKAQPAADSSTPAHFPPFLEPTSTFSPVHSLDHKTASRHQAK